MSIRPFRQPFVLPATSAAGTSRQTGDGPPAGFVDNVTLAFPTAPIAAQFTLTISGVLLGSWTGPTPYGPILLCNNETIEVDATGLVAGTVYQGIFMGSRHPADESPASAPQFGPTSVQVANLSGTALSTITTSFEAIAPTQIPVGGFLVFTLAAFGNYPAGMGPANFTSALITFHNLTGSAAPIGVSASDAGGTLLYEESTSIPVGGLFTALVPLAGVATIGIAGPAGGMWVACEMQQGSLVPPAVRAWCPQVVPIGAQAGFVPIQADPNGNQCVLTVASSSPANGQYAVTAAAAVAVAARVCRSGCTIVAPAANPASVFLGTSAAVTTANGFQLEPGRHHTIGAPGAIYAIAAAVGNSISFWDE